MHRERRVRPLVTCRNCRFDCSKTLRCALDAFIPPLEVRLNLIPCIFVAQKIPRADPSTIGKSDRGVGGGTPSATIRRRFPNRAPQLANSTCGMDGPEARTRTGIRHGQFTDRDRKLSIFPGVRAGHLIANQMRQGEHLVAQLHFFLVRTILRGVESLTRGCFL